MANQKPQYKNRFGAVQAAVWHQTSEQGDFFTVTVTRSYKEKESEDWKNSHSFQSHEIEAAIDALTDAKAWMREHQPAKAAAA